MTDDIIRIAREAGEAILEHYERPLPIEVKSDDSPLTQADLAAHRLILKRLRELTPDIPILSEESEDTPYETRREWTSFWLVDPMDGTKEFIKKSGQFTVNIAGIEDGLPRLGVIHAPAINCTFWASTAQGAFKSDNGKPAARIQSQVPSTQPPRIVASRDHAGPQVAQLLERFPGADTKSMGSSLKFCLVAEGAADIYLRDVPTMEWDTGAAQCIVESAGGHITHLDGTRLTYNKEVLRNPSLVCLADPDLHWQPTEL